MSKMCDALKPDCKGCRAERPALHLNRRARDREGPRSPCGTPASYLGPIEWNDM